MDSENKYGTLNAQKGLLELLKEFHPFCIQNDIRYSLAYGSLLGAIRHNGFIPWDDDLDVFVDRDNYNRLMKSLVNSDSLYVEWKNARTLWVDRVRMKSEKHDEFEPTIDILILDNVPEANIIRKIKLLLILILQGMLKFRLRLEKGSIAMKTCKIITFYLGRLFPTIWKKKWYRKVCQIGNSKHSQLVANYNGEYSDLKRCYTSEMMDHIIEHDFEDTKAYIVEDYDMCLTTQFGDYMTPPKECDRKPIHGGGE